VAAATDPLDPNRLGVTPSLRVNPRLEKDDTKIQNYSLNQCNITRFYLVTLIFIAIASG
jgi:hypothetical protein